MGSDKEYFVPPLSRGIALKFNAQKSIRANIEALLHRTKAIQTRFGRPHYAEAMLWHLVGAKLDLLLGIGKVEHHAFANGGEARNFGCYFANGYSIYTCMCPSEPLIGECVASLGMGVRPLIFTRSGMIEGSESLLMLAEIEDYVEILDVTQFLTTSIIRHSEFDVSRYEDLIVGLLARYNEIVKECESGNGLRIRIL